MFPCTLPPPFPLCLDSCLLPGKSFSLTFIRSLRQSSGIVHLHTQAFAYHAGPLLLALERYPKVASNLSTFENKKIRTIYFTINAWKIVTFPLKYEDPLHWRCPLGNRWAND